MPRPSPSDSATIFPVGTKKKGNDGKMYIVKKVGNSQRWVKYFSYPSGKKYFIHFNRGRPWVVITTKDEVYVVNNETNELLTRYEPDIVYIGTSKKGDHKPSESKKLNGNTVLLQFGDHKFISIQEHIFEFKLPSNDKPVKYYSLVGRNDVPYPVLEGEKNIYFLLLEDVAYINKSKFPKDLKNFEDAYSYYYGHVGKEPLDKYAKKLKIKNIYPKRISRR